MSNEKWLIPPSLPNCVVALGRDNQGKPAWIATGFLYGKFIKVIEDKIEYRVFLVTNRHVFEGLEVALIRCNPKDNKPAKIWGLRLLGPDKERLWYAPEDPSKDVAVIRVDIRKMLGAGMNVELIRSDSQAASKQKLIEIGISEGYGVYCLGFPMALTGGERNYAISRYGTIARIRDFLEGYNSEFLLDMNMFPGNSGGPIVLKPEGHLKTVYLIGLISKALVYQDPAVSMKTRRPRVIFEENAGLATAVPVDQIEEAIDVCLKTLPAESTLTEALGLGQDREPGTR